MSSPAIYSEGNRNLTKNEKSGEDGNGGQEEHSMERVLPQVIRVHCVTSEL